MSTTYFVFLLIHSHVTLVLATLFFAIRHYALGSKAYSVAAFSCGLWGLVSITVYLAWRFA